MDCVDYPDNIRPHDGNNFEMKCSICGDWWPMSSEFYYRNYGHFVPTCKTCWKKRYRPETTKTRRAPYTDKEKQRLYNLFETGETKRRIAEQSGIPYYTVIELFREYKSNLKLKTNGVFGG